MGELHEIAPGILRTNPRIVTAVASFRGESGRESEAAQAWAFELNYGFARGVGEQPAVTFTRGIYTVTGFIQTTDPADADTTVFSSPENPWDLDFCLAPERQARVRAAHAARVPADGRSWPARGPEAGRRGAPPHRDRGPGRT